MKKFMTLSMTLSCLLAICSVPKAEEDSLKISKENIQNAETVIGLELTDSERDSLLADASYNLDLYELARQTTIDNSIPPALYFNPLPLGFEIDKDQKEIVYSEVEVRRPENLNDLAYYSVRELGELIRTRQVTSMELTQLALVRLKTFDPVLHCVITLTEELALKQAAQADQEIAAGNYRGPLHGIPFGAKDLLAHKGYKTSWGAMPYKDQTIDYDATVLRKLEEAGAVLVAKLTLGALAWGDVWFADTTRNPWNIEQGSSGSSAGSASAVSAGLLPFAIGTETWGSIVSPSTRCGTTGLRPTYGRVSRDGAMALSWTMDKIGPICRTVEDCAIVFDAIRGEDPNDLSLVEAAFNYSPEIDLTKLRVGYLKSDFENDTSYIDNNEAALKVIADLGVELIPIELPDFPISAMEIILSAEAAAAFDDLTRSNRDDLMVRQVRDAWPNVFRASRFIPAVEYIQANRLRTLVINKMTKIFETVDLYIAPSFEGHNLLLTNLTSHPCVVLPDGFDEEGSPTSICFIGNLFDEATVLAFAKKYQDATDWHQQHPEQFSGR